VTKAILVGAPVIAGAAAAASCLMGACPIAETASTATGIDYDQKKPPWML
jgi:hypothetical protein